MSGVILAVKTAEVVLTVFFAVATPLGASLVVDTVAETVRLFRE